MASSLERETGLGDDVRAIGDGAGLGRAIGVHHAIELDDGPAVEADVLEGGHAALDVHTAASELDPLIAWRCVDRPHVLQVHDLDRLAMAADEGHGIAAPLLIV